MPTRAFIALACFCLAACEVDGAASADQGVPQSPAPSAPGALPPEEVFVMPGAIMQPTLVSPEDSDRLAFEQAAGAGTSAALIQFLARNPENPRISEARALLAARRAPDQPGTALRVAGTDAGVVEAFDAARLAGSATAWDAFLAAHGTHPLAREARLLRNGL